MMTKIYFNLPFKIKEPDVMGVYTAAPQIYIMFLWTDVCLTIKHDGTRTWRRRHFEAREITEEEALLEVGL